MPLRLGVIVDDPTLGGARPSDPVDVVAIRWTFLNPPRAAAAKRQAAAIRGLHPDAELVPYVWHYVTHEDTDGVEVTGNRVLEMGGKHGHFRNTADVGQAWEVSRICADAFGATRLIARTPASFSTGSLSRKRITEFVSTKLDGRQLVWEPTGLWSTEAAVMFAEALGVEVITPAIAMTDHVLDFEGATWLRVPPGKSGRLRSSTAESLAVALAELDLDGTSVTLLFDGPRAWGNLRTFQQVCETL